MSTLLKDKLIWLKGKKIAVSEPNAERFNNLKIFLENYGVEVVALNDVQAVQKDLQQRRFATKRVFFAVFVDLQVAEQVRELWKEVTEVNPLLLKTPIILTHDANDKVTQSDLVKTGYFRFCLQQPITANQVLRVLIKLNRWYGLRGEIAPSAIFES